MFRPATARACANIALVKYWGKRDASLNLPAAGSLSLTLAALVTETTVDFDAAATADSLSLDGASAGDVARTSAFLDLVRDRAKVTARARVTSVNRFPTASGLASSASGFAALAVAATRAVGLELSARELSILARRGSGSAARSIFGGFVRMHAAGDSYAEPIESSLVDRVRMVIAVVGGGAPKSHGSRDAMEHCAATSPLYARVARPGSARSRDGRARARDRRSRRCSVTVAEANALAMHATAIAARPAIVYWQPATLALLAVVRELRASGVAAWATMDAGPHVKVLTSVDDAGRVAAAVACRRRRQRRVDQCSRSGRGGDRVIASAPGKLIVAGEYAVLDGAQALVVAVNRRVTAKHAPSRLRGSSAFLHALADELAGRGRAEAARIAMEIVVDSSSFYDGNNKLGLGSSAAVTVAATALVLANEPSDPALVHDIAAAAHARAQAPRGSRGSGADIAAAVHGGTIAFTPRAGTAGIVARRSWPSGVDLIPFFTGTSADTPVLVAQVAAARAASPVAVDAALTAIADASRAACEAAALRDIKLAATAMIAALALAAAGLDRLELATGVALVPDRVKAARRRLAPLGGTAKTTGAGGGDVAIAVIPTTEDGTAVRRYLIELGCVPLALSVDPTGVDLRPDAQ